MKQRPGVRSQRRGTARVKQFRRLMRNDAVPKVCGGIGTDENLRFLHSASSQGVKPE